MKRPAVRTLLFAVLTAGVVSCSAPAPDPSMSSEQASAAVTEVAAAFASFRSSSSERHAAALARLTDSPLDLNVEVGLLPRGVYSFDPATGEWLLLGASETLELNWGFQHDGDHEGRLHVDWDANAPTTFIKLENGENHEAPQGVKAELSIDGVPSGEVNLGADYAANACGYSEPTSVDLSGNLGTSATEGRLEVSGLSFALTEDQPATFTSDGDIAVLGGDDSLDLDWHLTLTGDVMRDADTCHIDDFDVSSGEVSVDLGADVFGRQKALGISTRFSGIEVDPVTEAVSIDLTDGRILLDGVLAVRFDGVLDDPNNNGVPGDDLTLTFAAGEAMTLEEFVLGYFPRLAGVLRVGAALR